MKAPSITTLFLLLLLPLLVHPPAPLKGVAFLWRLKRRTHREIAASETFIRRSNRERFPFPAPETRSSAISPVLRERTITISSASSDVRDWTPANEFIIFVGRFSGEGEGTERPLFCRLIVEPWAFFSLLTNVVCIEG